MPKYVCRECQHEFWGWGVRYQQKSGNRIVCPDCKGNLILQKEQKEKDGENKVMKGSTAA
ncbi:MAG: hypothetical protein HY889_07190 [Deltaproteobacteria bacterium]|nr:hypothetical protein [Deltaproteobacteria bacterium]